VEAISAGHDSTPGDSGWGTSPIGSVEDALAKVDLGLVGAVDQRHEDLAAEPA
jgi:hypothetical protein